MTKTQIKCPQCQAVVSWQDNPHRPFCSERCQLIDLGQWADESYRIPGAEPGMLSDEEMLLINNEETKH
jgi:endogenous inhibitor of DNA gyrase (YacG/DUF329 family)